MDEKSIIKSPRLYTELALSGNCSITLDGGQAHYLKNVLRKNAGDALRLFNGRDGEWLANIAAASKKEVIAELTKQIRPQPEQTRRVHAFFAPIKKHRMDMLIEKAVELGTTDLHPVATQNTEIRKLNEERIKAQITEAAEQCERLDPPKLHGISDLIRTLGSTEIPILAAIERGEYLPAEKVARKYEGQRIAVLVGPEGGFTQEEVGYLLKQNNIIPVSLGPNILRAETALMKILSLL